jgi:hypothetical protein
MDNRFITVTLLASYSNIEESLGQSKPNLDGETGEGDTSINVGRADRGAKSKIRETSRTGSGINSDGGSNNTAQMVTKTKADEVVELENTEQMNKQTVADLSVAL